MTRWNLSLTPRLGGGYSGRLSKASDGSGCLGALFPVVAFMVLIGLPFAIVGGAARLFISPQSVTQSNVEAMSWVGCSIYVALMVAAAFTYGSERVLDGGSFASLLGALAVLLLGWIPAFLVVVYTQFAHWPLALIFRDAPNFGESGGYAPLGVYMVGFAAWVLTFVVFISDFVRSVGQGSGRRRNAGRY